MKTAETIQELLSSSSTVAKVKDWLQKNKDKGRSALAQYLCRALNITDHQGKPRIAGVHVALRILESRGFWKLPKLKQGARARQQFRRLNAEVPAPEAVPGQVEQIKGLRLVEVGTGEDQLFRTWNELILTEHPLKDCRLVGRQLRYLIGSDHGWLGAIGFGSCALHLRARDEWIEWDSSTRKRFQDRVINMTRFLIRPWVSVRGLASKILSLASRQLPKDWQQMYGYRPLLLETLVDPARFRGTSYRAANWICLGKTQGRGRMDKENRARGLEVKDIYVFPVCRDARRRLCQSQPPAPAGAGSEES